MNENINYCQLDINNICVGVSSLSGEVAEYNYNDEPIFNPITGLFETPTTPTFKSRMIKVNVYSTAYLGLHWNDTTNSWEKV